VKIEKTGYQDYQNQDILLIDKKFINQYHQHGKIIE